MKRVEEISRAGNFALHLKHVPSSGNIADAPSRALSDSDCSLPIVAWARVQSRCGPHTFDLTSLDSNCCRSRDRNFLPHYSPWPTPNSSGTNAFAQAIPSEHNVYVSPFRPCRTALAIFLRSTPAFRLYHYCPSFLSASLLVGNSSSFSGRFFCPRKEGQSVCSTISFPLLPGFHPKFSAMGSMGFSLFLPWINCSFPAL